MFVVYISDIEFFKLNIYLEFNKRFEIRHLTFIIFKF